MKKPVFVLIAAGALLAAAPSRGQDPPASAETEWDGVRLEVDSVARKGSVMTVKWTVENAGETARSFSFTLTGKRAGTYALDEESGTKYFALTDEEGPPLATRAMWGADGYYVPVKLEPGADRRLWMKLPAPPPEVESILLVFDGTEPLEALPITDR